ncbi:hypothetical protein LPB248_14570 [Flavobacterium sp. LPB0248]|uniref:hypothetical protein n=1 Tax=Flavobacterium sp. LPB0248 TaxID=2614441 RepID=UPI0015A5CCC1|nr:hypothetical protein [Flavobacterium sp. LPB0248]QLC67482.1 hypothetical protein LPB248_14570 [Flavobacterium sp. LPB0248]
MHEDYKDTRVMKLFVLLFFFSSIINYYLFPTFLITEIFVFFVVIRGVIKGKAKAIHKHFFSALMLSFFSLIIFFYGSLLPKNELDGLVKESYRFLFIPFMMLPFYFIDPDYKKIFYLILLLCRFCILFNLYEVIYINLIDPGGIKNSLLGNAIYGFFNDVDTSDYFLPQGEFGIPFIRPFGLWLQPQKSAFVFPLAIIVEYVYSKDFDKKVYTNFWYVLFIVSCILSGAKTALIASIFIVYIIKIDFLKVRMSLKQFWFLTISLFLFVFGGVGIWSFSQSGHGSASAMSIELATFVQLPLFSKLFGIGFINTYDFLSYGFTGESFLIRFAVQIGVVFFIFYICFFALSIIKKIDKINILLVVVIFFMILHYAVINVYFFTNIICFLFYYNNEFKNEKRNSIS